mmetsp:Transcript_24216/g.60145  ORF Transcript_24216/g.60145 Transcript_24216/m.60145 type:complete len:225 (+) Transcript_24216:3299-3973(+)
MAETAVAKRACSSDTTVISGLACHRRAIASASARATVARGARCSAENAQSTPRHPRGGITWRQGASSRAGSAISLTLWSGQVGMCIPARRDVSSGPPLSLHPARSQPAHRADATATHDSARLSPAQCSVPPDVQASSGPFTPSSVPLNSSMKQSTAMCTAVSLGNIGNAPCAPAVHPVAMSRSIRRSTRGAVDSEVSSKSATRSDATPSNTPMRCPRMSPARIN